MNNIKVTVGGPIGPGVKVKVLANGIVEPTNPVIIGPTAYSNDIENINNTINNAAAIAYSNAVTYINTDLENIDGGEF